MNKFEKYGFIKNNDGDVLYFRPFFINAMQLQIIKITKIANFEILTCRITTSGLRDEDYRVTASFLCVENELFEIISKIKHVTIIEDINDIRDPQPPISALIEVIKNKNDYKQMKRLCEYAAFNTFDRNGKYSPYSIYHKKDNQYICTVETNNDISVYDNNEGMLKEYTILKLENDTIERSDVKIIGTYEDYILNNVTPEVDVDIIKLK